jgi:hypothetical protein
MNYIDTTLRLLPSSTESKSTKFFHRYHCILIRRVKRAAITIPIFLLLISARSALVLFDTWVLARRLSFGMTTSKTGGRGPWDPGFLDFRGEGIALRVRVRLDGTILWSGLVVVIGRR